MSQINNINSAFNAVSNQGTATSTLNEVNLDDFLKIMIVELQNQDPLNPLENDELISQIAQIRSVGATDKLTKTLDSVLLGQNISSATNLIGAEIDGLSEENERVTGVVERVSITGGQPTLHLDLNPHATVSTEPGDVEAGEYEYRVVWEEGGSLFGVDPLAGAQSGSLTVTGESQSILLSNLPISTQAKQVFRREKGEQDFRLVGSINNVKQATYLDSTASDDLSSRVLSGTPQLLDPARSFTVKLNNVGEIRPRRM